MLVTHGVMIVAHPSIYGNVSSGEEKDQKEMVIERRLSQALIPGDHLIKVQLVKVQL